MDYPRYKPSLRRPPGAGAFFDWNVFVIGHGTLKLKSCRIDRRWSRKPSGMFAPAAAPAAPAAAAWRSALRHSQ